MLEDRRLLRKLRRGDAAALQSIYEKYKHDLLGLAVTLSHDKGAGEDIVHDVFVSFVRFTPKLRLRTSLRSYLLTSVANRARSLQRTKARPVPAADPAGDGTSNADRPDRAAMQREQAIVIDRAMAQLPYDQREAVVLHLQAGMKFREIASSQNVSINTVQSHYRYGLQKLRSLLDGKVTV
jgi:RNA polymerase sigma-70 factor (ECF subfamily)